MPDGEELTGAHAQSRRNFLASVGRLSFVAGLAGIFTSTMRFLLPNVLYEPPTNFTVGSVDQFPPDSITFLEEHRMFVFRRPEGLYAVSSECTHLGCNVRWNAGRKGFDCPCHGSTFDQDGKNVSGPAPKPLKWYELTLASEGRLRVNTRSIVETNFRLKA
jgi:cytochrome b6-f complex iron-sulfur subunit